MKFAFRVSLLLCVFGLGLPSFQTRVPAAAFYGEVMYVQGSSFLMAGGAIQKQLKVGDLVKVGNIIKVEDQSELDLAFDRDWNNLVHVAENTEIAIKSVYPTGIRLQEGEVLAMLDALIEGDTFEIETPTAITGVRGSRYRVKHRLGKTDVFNVSKKSPVWAYPLDLSGKIQKNPATLNPNQKTNIPQLGASPGAPQGMTQEELKDINALIVKILRRVGGIVQSGRKGKTLSLKKIMAARKKAGLRVPALINRDEMGKNTLRSRDQKSEFERRKPAPKKETPPPRQQVELIEGGNFSKGQED